MVEMVCVSPLFTRSSGSSVYKH